MEIEFDPDKALSNLRKLRIISARKASPGEAENYHA
jgi:uncharacterized DUF497 family protein